MAASVSTVGAVNRATLNLNGVVRGASSQPSSSFYGNRLKKGNSKIGQQRIPVGKLKVRAEYDEEKQTSKDRWRGLAYDTSDDQQDITRGKGMVDTLFQAPMDAGTHYAVLSSYDYISAGLRQYSLDNNMDGFYIAPAFMDKVVVHITKNFLNLPNIKVPLILGIWGGKGQGKSFQCELVFAKMGINPIVMSAGELESGNAGEPAKLIRQRYREAADIIKKGKMCCLFINDLDAGAGRLGGTTQYTVNNQMVNATLMNIADNPTSVQLPGMYNKEENPRVPIIVTGNDFSWLGELQLAGGALGLTFANVTGFSILNGLCGAMEPICGQARGAKNVKLLHKTLLMVTLLLLLVTIPISFLWLNVDKILIHFGQQEDIAIVAKNYLFYLLPNLVVTSFLCPLKAYLSSQTITVPIMLGSALALACHVPINIFLSKAKGLEGVSMAFWISDLIVVILLAMYIFVVENRKERKWKEGGWWDQGYGDWKKLLKLSGPCCLTTCLEWWCYEILVLLTGRLENPKQAVGVITIVLNFDYLLYSVMLSLSTCVSTRVSNELGANRAGPALHATYVSLAASVILGFIGSLLMVAARGSWGALFSHNKGIIRGVKKTMLLMALVEIMNFPLTVCGGIVRGTARPLLAMYANLSGFYLLALPLGVVFAFKVALGLCGLLIGILIGAATCLVLLLVFVFRINWDEEAGKAQILASVVVCHASGSEMSSDGDHKTVQTVDNDQV